MKGLVAALLILVLIAIVVSLVLAQGGELAIGRFVIAGGSGRLKGGNFAVRGTAGQPEAGFTSGGDFSLSGGFWPGITGGPAGGRVYLPVVVR